MAIAIQNVYSQIGDADQTMAITVSSGATMLVVCVGIHQGTVIDVQANSVSLTRGPQSATAFDERVEIWYQVNPTLGTYNVFFDGTTGSGRAVCAYVLTGTKTTGQPDTSVGSTFGSSSTASVSITPTVANCLIIDAHYSEDAFGAVGAGQTSRANLQGNDTFEDFASSTTQQTTAVAETMSWSINSGQRWASAAVAIAPTSSATSFLKLETGTFIKLETGNRIGIE